VGFAFRRPDRFLYDLAIFDSNRGVTGEPHLPAGVMTAYQPTVALPYCSVSSWRCCSHHPLVAPTIPDCGRADEAQGVL
jgi:hypothetical protein